MNTKRMPDAETLRVDMGIALRDAQCAFDREDYDKEKRCYERAQQLWLDICHAERHLK